MGRLAGFRYRQIIKRLKAFGFAFDRQAAGISWKESRAPASQLCRFNGGRRCESHWSRGNNLWQPPHSTYPGRSIDLSKFWDENRKKNGDMESQWMCCKEIDLQMNHTKRYQLILTHCWKGWRTIRTAKICDWYAIMRPGTYKNSLIIQ